MRADTWDNIKEIMKSNEEKIRITHACKWKYISRAWDGKRNICTYSGLYMDEQVLTSHKNGEYRIFLEPGVILCNALDRV